MYRIAGGAGDRRNDITFFTDEGIDDGRFAHVRSAYDGEFGERIFFNRLFVKMLYHFVEQLAGARTRHRRDIVDLTQTKAVKNSSFRYQGIVIDLVYHH